MIQHFLNYILSYGPFLAENHLYFYGLLFLIALAESTPVIGTFAPGAFVLLIFGFLAFQDYGSLGPEIIVASLGATIGEMIGYAVGRQGKSFLRDHKGAFKYSQLDAAKRFFDLHDGKSVCFGRFIGPMRPVISIFAGVSEMPFGKFFWWNILGSLLWSAIYLVLGFLFGAHWKVIGTWGARVGLVVFVLAVSGIYIYMSRKKLKGQDKTL